MDQVAGYPSPSRVEVDLLRRASAPGPDGLIVSVDPASAGWEYTDLAVYRLELDHIWARSWHYVCGVDAIPDGHRLGEQAFEVTAGPDGTPGSPSPLPTASPGHPTS